MLRKEEKTKIIKESQRHDKDTGSTEVQINILNKEIEELLKHLSAHKHDYSSRRGLIKKVCQRRKLLKYLAAEDPKAYKKMLKKIKSK
ncbi:30S ribosomal protein S15 [bacterium]|nr:30S ribosomal protein S15 [bacterium]